MTVTATFKEYVPGQITVSNVTLSQDYFGQKWYFTFDIDGYAKNITAFKVNKTAWTKNTLVPSLGGQYYPNTNENRIEVAAMNFSPASGAEVLQSGDSIAISATGYDDLKLKFVVDKKGTASLVADDGKGDLYELRVKIDGTFEAAIVGQKDYDGVSGATSGGTSSNKNSAVTVYGALVKKESKVQDSDWEPLNHQSNISLNGKKCKVNIVPDTASGTPEASDSGMKGVYLTLSSDLTLDGTPKDAGEYTVRVTYPADDNYEKSSVAKDFTIKKMKTRVSAIDLSKTYGEKGYELMYSFDRLARGDRLTGIILTREEGEDVGTYKIKVSQKEGSNPNYDITFKDGTYTINPLSIDKGTVVLRNVLKYTGEKQTQEVEQVVINGKVLSKDDYEVIDHQAVKEGKHILKINGKGNYTGTIEYAYVILPKDSDKIGEGTLTVKTTGNVEINKNDLIDTLVENKEITANELSEIANGKELEFVLDVKESSSNKFIESSTKEYIVGKYLDITLYKNIDGTNKSIHELTKKLKISIELPTELINKDKTITRTYFIARSHNGKVDILETNYDEKTNKLTFETDKFSDYAIIYKDKKELKTTVTASINKSNTKQTTKAKTGDNANIIGLMMLLVSSMFVMVFVRKKEN